MTGFEYLLIACLAHGIWASLFIIKPTLRDLADTLSICYNIKFGFAEKAIFQIVFSIAIIILSPFIIWFTLSNAEAFRMLLYKNILEAYDEKS